MGAEEEVSVTATKNIIKQDTILKNFWKDNHHFADLFNAALFDGEQILKPEDLNEVDTDMSSILKFNGHAETVQKVFDVVKKTAYGVDFVLWGLENQAKIHYAMPLRHMLGDAFSYLKEYNEIAAQNKKEQGFSSSDEFLSNLKKTDRLHPVVSLCVYYGEKEWDGPFCLTDMLQIPEKLKLMVSDYKMNLLQLRSSGDMCFRNPDVEIVFDISRAIYERNFEKINILYREKEIPAELGIVIGTITESKQLIDHALQSGEKGGQFNMCSALEELKQEGKIEGRLEGKIEGIIANIRTCKNFNIGKDEAIENLMKVFDLPREEAVEYIEQYW